MEAPEKIFIDDPTGEFNDNWSIYSNNISTEYICADAFIEKACEAFCKVCKMPNCNSKDCSYLKDFRSQMKGE